MFSVYVVLLLPIVSGLRFTQLANCGKTRGCWLLPSGCTHDCTAIVSWQHQGKAVLVEIEAKLKKGVLGSWVGFGFSRDDRMVRMIRAENHTIQGNDTVLECRFPSGKSGSVRLSHNIQNSNVVLPQATDFLLKDSFVEEYEGKFWCGTEWILDYTILPQDEKQMLHRLNTGEWKLFYAYGELDGLGEKQSHAPAGLDAPWKSAETIRFCHSCPAAFQIADEHLTKF